MKSFTRYYTKFPLRRSGIELRREAESKSSAERKMRRVENATRRETIRLFDGDETLH